MPNDKKEEIIVKVTSVDVVAVIELTTISHNFCSNLERARRIINSEKKHF